MININTHPLYPERYNINADDYHEKCPFYEHPCLEKNQDTWADKQNVSQEELASRYMWKWESNKATLITLKEGNIVFENGKPVTPIKTGIKGRGLLGKYGPNHAADPIITRTINGEYYFVAIKRNDTGEWAIPGGMVDPGENGIETLRREFKEEACENCDDSVLDMVFAKENGKIIYAGPTYGDPRTTDSAWIETIVVNYHISDELANEITLTPQKSEVKDVKWISFNENVYGGHKHFINMVKDNLDSEKINIIKKQETINNIYQYKSTLNKCFQIDKLNHSCSIC